MSTTPLGAKLKDRIRRDGPIDVGSYMAACLSDPEHGYYRRKLAIGADGDFTTAPEISQVFGELIGLWCAVVWQQMGKPERVHLVELGPGRGTLMKDALRAAAVVPAFLDSAALHFVDTNEALRSAQLASVEGFGGPFHLHDDAAKALDPQNGIARGPTIVVANEFLDALPVDQLVFHGGHWRERVVALDDQEQFCFSASTALSSEPRRLPLRSTPKEDDVFETSPAQASLAQALSARAHCAPLAALFIDYGHAAAGLGDTLQGVAQQGYVTPFHAPGEVDLSAQVDFQNFGDACRSHGVAVDGPVSQAEFLGRLGIVERASRLMARNPAKALAIESQVQRLMAPSGMGSRFLAIGIRSPELAPLPGLA